MKAPDELRPGGALESVGGKKGDQGGEQQNRREREKTKAQPQRRLANRKCHAAMWPRQWREQCRKLNQAKTSATTRAGFTLVSFCSSPWKE